MKLRGDFCRSYKNLLLFHGHVRQVRWYIVDFAPVGEMSAENESSIES